MSAGAPTLSVPRSSNAGNMRAAFTVAQAITWLSGMPNIRNFDMTLGKSTTPGLLRDMAFQSVENVSGQKPCLVARSTMSQLKWPPPPLPKSKRMPRRRAADTSGNSRPWSSRMLLGGGAYMWVTMSPRLSSARMARIGVVLADMDHHRQIEGRSRLLGTPQCFEIVGAGHVCRQSRLDTDHDIAVARDSAARQTHVGAGEVHKLSAGS